MLYVLILACCKTVEAEVPVLNAHGKSLTGELPTLNYRHSKSEVDYGSIPVLVIVKRFFGVNECANDIEGVERVTGEAVTETDLSSTGTECLCPLRTSGSVELNLDLAFKSGTCSKVVKNGLEVVSSESLLVVINGRTVNKSDILSSIVAVVICICSKDCDSSLHLLLSKVEVVTGKSRVSLVKSHTGKVVDGPLAISALSVTVSAKDTCLSLYGVTVLTAGVKVSSVFNVIVVCNVYKAEARSCSTGPDLLNDVGSVKCKVECLTELCDCKNTVVVSALLKNSKVGEELHTEGTGGAFREGNVLRIKVVAYVLSSKRSVVEFALKEAHPSGVGLFYLTAVDSIDLVLALVGFHVPTVPVGVLLKLVVRTSLKLGKHVGTPACSRCKRRVVSRGPKSSASCGSYLVSLVESLVYKGKRGHVVSSPNGERIILVEEGVCNVKTYYESVLALNLVHTYGIPRASFALTCNVEEGISEVCFLSICIEIRPGHTERLNCVRKELLSCINKLSSDQGVTVLVCCILDNSKSCESLVSTNVVGNKLGKRIAEQCHISAGSVHIELTGGKVYSLIFVRSVDRRIMEEVIMCPLDHKIFVISESTVVQKVWTKQLLHRIYEVVGCDGSTVVPFKIVTKSDLPGVSALCLLLLEHLVKLTLAEAVKSIGNSFSCAGAFIFDLKLVEDIVFNSLKSDLCDLLV